MKGLRNIGIGVLGLAVMLAAGGVHAQGGAAAGGAVVAPAAAKEVQLTVRLVEATQEEKPFLDESLKALEKHVRRNAAYNAFRLVKLHDLEVPLGGSGEVRLPGDSGQTLVLSPTEIQYEETARRIKMQTKVERKFKTTVRMTDGLTYGYALNHGKGLLLILITAKIAEPGGATAPAAK